MGKGVIKNFSPGKPNKALRPLYERIILKIAPRKY